MIIRQNDERHMLNLYNMFRLKSQNVIKTLNQQLKPFKKQQQECSENQKNYTILLQQSIRTQLEQGVVKYTGLSDNSFIRALSTL